MLPAQRDEDSSVRSRLRSAHLSAECSRPSAHRRLRSREASEPRCAPTRRNTSSSSALRWPRRVRIATPDGPTATKGAAIVRNDSPRIDVLPSTTLDRQQEERYGPALTFISARHATCARRNTTNQYMFLHTHTRSCTSENEQPPAPPRARYR